MNQDIKEMWNAALLSEEYRQTRGKLRKLGTNQFCCLGVLCDVLGAEWVVEKGKAYDEDADKTIELDLPCPMLNGKYLDRNLDGQVSGGYIGTTISYETCELVGINGYEAAVLADMNDSGTSFADIAKYIEENL